MIYLIAVLTVLNTIAVLYLLAEAPKPSTDYTGAKSLDGFKFYFEDETNSRGRKIEKNKKSTKKAKR